MATDDPGALGAGIDQGFAKLADKIVGDLFVTARPADEEDIKPRAGTAWTVVEK